MKNKIIASITILITIVCFIYSNYTIKSFTDSLDMIVKIILPSLLPFMIIVNFLIFFNGIEILGFYLQYISIPLFNISGYGCIAILSSIFGGYPYSAIIVNELIKKKKITKEEGQRIINFIFLPSISFIIALLSINKTNYPIVLKVMISVYISGFIFLLFTKSKKNKCQYVSHLEMNKNICSKTNYFASFNKIIKATTSSILNICFCIIIFSIIKNYLFLVIKNELFYFLGGLLEFSESSISILSLETLNFLHYLILAFILSFCSFSIFFQASFYIKEANLSMKKLITSRFIVSLFSCLILTILFFID